MAQNYENMATAAGGRKLLRQRFGNPDPDAVPFQVFADWIGVAAKIGREQLISELGADLPPDRTALIRQEGFYAAAKVPSPESGRFLGVAGIVGTQDVRV